MRIPNWDVALITFCNSLRGQTVDWGVNDCLQFGAGCVEVQTGRDFAAAHRGKYHDEETARAYMLAHGWADVDEAVSAHLPRVDVRARRRGDILCFVGDFGKTIGVCLGARAAVMAQTGLGQDPLCGLHSRLEGRLMPVAAAGWVASTLIAATGHVVWTSSLAYLTLQTAALAAITYGVSALTRPDQVSSSSLLDTQVASDAPRTLLVGVRQVGGSRVGRYVHGQNNNTLIDVIALIDHRCEGCLEFKANGVTYLEDLAHGVKYPIDDFRADDGARLFVTWYDGRPDQTADAYLTGIAFAANLPDWTANHRARGVSYIIVEQVFDDNVMLSPVDASTVMKGGRWYDRRQDDTAGGDGDHRHTKPATWTYSNNPDVFADHYQLGIVPYEDAPLYSWGIGLKTWQLPYEQFKEEADISDEAVLKKDGVTEIARYALNSVFFGAQTHKEIIIQAAKAKAGRVVDHGGRLTIVGPQARTPVMTLYDGDLAAGTQSSYADKQSISGLFNTFRGTFPDPESGFNPIEYPPLTDEDWVAEDGGDILQEDVDVSVDTDSERVQRLVYLYAKDRRRQARLTETYGAWAAEIEDGDWYERTGRRFPTGKLFEAIRVEHIFSRDKGCLVNILGKEVDPSDVAWDADQAAELSRPPPPTQEVAFVPLPTPNIDADPTTIAGAGGTSKPALLITWDNADDDERIRSAIIQWVVSGGGPVTEVTVDAGPSAANGVRLDLGVTNGVTYLVRMRFQGLTKPSEWSSSIPVTTGSSYIVGEASSVAWSGVTGSGKPADNATVGAIYGTNLLETGGGATATLANFKTILGVSASIIGQGAFALLSSAAYGSAYLTGFGSIAPLSQIFFGDGFLKETTGGSSASLANFKTILGVAASITSQGNLATLNQFVSGNGVRNSEFALGTQGWSTVNVTPLWALSIEDDFQTGSKRKIINLARTTGGNVAGTDVYLGVVRNKNGDRSDGHWTAVAGERYYVSVDFAWYAGGIETDRAAMYVEWYDTSGTVHYDGLVNIQPSASGTWATGAAVWTAPANCVYFCMYWDLYDLNNSNTTSVRQCWFRKPQITKLATGQVDAPYVSGPDAYRAADITASNVSAGFTGQGGLATVSFVTIGTDVRRADGLTVATESVLITSLGVAASITSQGTFATLSAINSTLADSNNLLRKTSGGLFTGELAADVTITHTAASITSQGGLATINFITIGTNIRLADGTTIATTAMVVTASGTAAAIASQGALATLNQVNAGNLSRNSEFGMGTQGWGDAAISPAWALTIENDFETGSTRKIINAARTTGGTTGGGFGGNTYLGVIRNKNGDRSDGHWSCVPGERYLFAIDFAYWGGGLPVDQASMYAEWYEANGTVHYSGLLAVTAAAAGAWNHGEVVWTVPATAAYFCMYFDMYDMGSTNTTSARQFWMRKPQITKLSTGQTTALYEPGPDAYRAADVTLVNVSASIVSQGSQAIANAQRGTSYSGTPVEGSWWADTSVTNVTTLKFYTGGSWNIVAQFANTVNLSCSFSPSSVSSTRTGGVLNVNTSPTATAANGSGSYTYSWSLAYLTDETMVPPALANAETATVTMTRSGIAPGNDYIGKLRCTVTDTATGVQKSFLWSFSYIDLI